MLRFAEEIMLLLLDDKGGKFADVPPMSFEYGLAAAVLMDLALEGQIDTDPDRLFVIDTTPLEDDLLDPTLRRIVQSAETRGTAHWIRQTFAHAVDIRESALARLVGRGILERKDDRFMWVFWTRRYPVIENKIVREVKLRIIGVLLSDEIPDARDIVLISLSDVCGIFKSLLSGRELKVATLSVFKQMGQMFGLAKGVFCASFSCYAACR